MLDAFIENANKSEAVETAPLADMADLQKADVFCNAIRRPSKNPPKTRVRLGQPTSEISRSQIVFN